jgi:hypothetical protein
MEKHTVTIGDFLADHAVNRSVAELGFRLAWPILQTARMGRYQRRDDAHYEPSAFIAAVADASGKTVRSVDTVWQRNVFDAQRADVRYGSLVHFNDSLVIALYNARWQRLKEQMIAAYGYGGHNDVHDALWACIRREVAQPLGFQFWDNSGEAPISSAGESLATTLYYLLASAMVGDIGSVDAMERLVRLEARWIPIGEKKGKAGSWLAVAPAL